MCASTSASSVVTRPNEMYPATSRITRTAISAIFAGADRLRIDSAAVARNEGVVPAVVTGGGGAAGAVPAGGAGVGGVGGVVELLIGFVSLGWFRYFA